MDVATVKGVLCQKGSVLCLHFWAVIASGVTRFTELLMLILFLIICLSLGPCRNWGLGFVGVEFQFSL